MTATDRAAAPRQRLVLVTGMSGAGRSSALKLLEDMGYEAVDNMPLALVGALRAAAGLRPLAIGIDVRTRDFGAAPVFECLDRLSAEGGFDARLVFFDSTDDVLRRRFTETRRPHPLALDRPVGDGIAQERRLLADLRERADIVIDTSDLAPADLRRLLSGHFALSAAPTLSVFVQSFSFRHGIPREADLVFDVRFLSNPHYVAELRPLTGLDAACAAFIAADAAWAPFFGALTGLFDVLMAGYMREGKTYLTVAVGCTGGRHRSVFVADRLADWLRRQRHKVDVIHRDVDKGART
ncbi:MAG: RNase adapter RapZ [Alphaproteobacteria bacterium]|nr:RNase adapter RapZ [Alphaproteobacteria bacterium]